jgi:hypothetical protein
MVTVPATDQLARARALTRMLDDAVRVPGTNIRLGLDPLIGLIPGFGDVAGAAFSVYLMVVASRLGAPTSVIIRMLANVGIDTVVGSVPVLGDLFDVGWKSNTRNLALIERHVAQPQAVRAASRAVIASIIAAILLVAAGGVALAVFVVRALVAGAS